MSNGVKPGERRGGRRKGTPNKATVDRDLLADRIAAEQRGRPGRKLAREVLDDLMHTFLGLAAKHQPAISRPEVGWEEVACTSNALE